MSTHFESNHYDSSHYESNHYREEEKIITGGGSFNDLARSRKRKLLIDDDKAMLKIIELFMKEM